VGWHWDVIEEGAELERLAPAWDAAAARMRLSAFSGAAFALAYRTAFVPEPGRLAVHVLRRDGEIAAIVPLERRGRWARVWSSFDNDHAPACEFPLSTSADAAAAVVEHLLEAADVVVLRPLSTTSPHYHALRAAASRLDVPLRAGPTGGDTFLRLGQWEDFAARIPSKLRSSIRARLAGLERSGRVEFRRLDGGPDLLPTLERCFRVEESGWKGASGSPIRSRDDTRRFYCELAQRASALGQLALYVLEVDGTPVAFRYALRCAGRLDSLKTGYLPAWARYAPGVLSKFLMARREIAEGRVRTMHFGAPSADKLRWASGVLELGTLRLYGRSGRGRVAYAGPALLHRALARWPAADSALGWGRRAMRRLREETHRSRVALGKRLAAGGAR